MELENEDAATHGDEAAIPEAVPVDAPAAEPVTDEALPPRT